MIKFPRRLKKLSNEEYEKILRRSRVKIEETMKVVIPVVKEVEEKGDEAIIKYTKKFDGISLKKEGILVKREKIKGAYKRVDPEVLGALERMQKQLEDFHIRQKRDNLIFYKSL